jgi:hypothetical protein
MFQVYDRDRALQFEGELLAHASSYKSGVERWVEFDLYRTKGGSYVVSRIGYSYLYHAEGCSVVRKNRHKPAQVATLIEGSMPCSLCNPVASVDQAHELIYPERPLHWAQPCSTPESAVEALAKYDEDGNRYFTHVARQLIRDASERDPALRDAYYIETIA